ncbi:PHP domain-containing protein [Candidatus Omnitrophota bacterium]
MSKLADLHVHTYLSDGTFPPEKVVEYSKEKGLSAIAITDHDCCLGIAPAIKAAKDKDIEVIPGVELTAELGEEEIHILGYFIDWQNSSFLKKLDEISGVRQERAKKILEKLRGEGVEISGKELLDLSGPGSVGRLHIAHLLVKKGVVSSISRAFEKYIGNNSPCCVKKFKLSPKEAVNMIKDVGGIAVLAHPSVINVKGESVEDVIRALVAEGIEGIEAYHSDYSDKDESKFVELAEKYNLLVTGGSDCHGLGKKEVLIGKVKIPYELVERMKEFVANRADRAR